MEGARVPPWLTKEAKGEEGDDEAIGMENGTQGSDTERERRVAWELLGGPALSIDE